MTDTKAEAPKTAKPMTDTKAVIYEIYHGNIYMPDKQGKLVKHECVPNEKGEPSDPVSFTVHKPTKDVIAALNARKGVRAV